MRPLRDRLVSTVGSLLPAGVKALVRRVWNPWAGSLAATRTSPPAGLNIAALIPAGTPVVASARASIVIVSWNGADLTRLCVQSVLRGSLWSDLEVVVVDNASSDGSKEMLAELAANDSRVTPILNETNRGFAAAANQGIRASSGELLVLLNNDVITPAGWLPRLLRHLDDPETGLVTAVTNWSGNESRIAVPYINVEQMPAFAEQWMSEHAGQTFDIPVAAMYCTAMTRRTFDRIGALDEAFEVGFFEDDDYSRRARLAGLRVICARDVFVHHFGQASFGSLDRKQFDTIFERNRERYERKWGKG